MLNSQLENKLSFEQQKQALQDLIVSHYKDSLFALANKGLNYQQMTEGTHKPICDMLQSPTKKKLLVVPRGCFKSTICSISFPIWLLINDPNHRILLDSEIFTNSSRFLREIKGHLESKKMVNLFGQFRSDSTWNDTEIIIKQRTKIYKEGSITCSGVAANKTGQHYSVIIADDLSSLDNSMSQDQRDKVIEHYRLYISLLDPGGTLVVVGTRYSHGDIIGHILDNEVNPGLKKGLIT